MTATLFDFDTALAAMRAAHDAVERKGISPGEPAVVAAVRFAMAGWPPGGAATGGNLGVLLAGCGELADAAARLPAGSFPWAGRPTKPGR